eukprot:gene1103-3941_t
MLQTRPGSQLVRPRPSWVTVPLARSSSSLSDASFPGPSEDIQIGGSPSPSVHLHLCPNLLLDQLRADLHRAQLWDNMYVPPLSAHNLEPTRYIDPTYSAPYAPGLVEHQFPKAYNIIIAFMQCADELNPACVLSPDFARYRPGYGNSWPAACRAIHLLCMPPGPAFNRARSRWAWDHAFQGKTETLKDFSQSMLTLFRLDQPPVDPTFDLAYHIVGRLALPGFPTSSGFFPFFVHSATADHFRHLIAKHINGEGCSGVRPIVIDGFPVSDSDRNLRSTKQLPAPLLPHVDLPPSLPSVVLPVGERMVDATTVCAHDPVIVSPGDAIFDARPTDTQLAVPTIGDSRAESHEDNMAAPPTETNGGATFPEFLADDPCTLSMLVAPVDMDVVVDDRIIAIEEVFSFRAQVASLQQGLATAHAHLRLLEDALLGNELPAPPKEGKSSAGPEHLTASQDAEQLTAPSCEGESAVRIEHADMQLTGPSDVRIEHADMQLTGPPREGPSDVGILSAIAREGNGGEPYGDQTGTNVLLTPTPTEGIGVASPGWNVPPDTCVLAVPAGGNGGEPYGDQSGAFATRHGIGDVPLKSYRYLSTALALAVMGDCPTAFEIRDMPSRVLGIG